MGGWSTPSPLSENLPKSFPPRLDPLTTNHKNLGGGGGIPPPLPPPDTYNQEAGSQLCFTSIDTKIDIFNTFTERTQYRFISTILAYKISLL